MRAGSSGSHVGLQSLAEGGVALSPEPRGGASEDKGSALPEQRRPAGRPGREGSDLNQSLIPEFTLRGSEGAESLFRVQRLIP